MQHRILPQNSNYAQSLSDRDVMSIMQAPARTRIVDATGKFVMPGGIDPHTHLDAEMGWGSKAEIISTDDFFRSAWICNPWSLSSVYVDGNIGHV